MAPPAGSRENPLPRRAARVLLVDAEERVLLFRGTDPGRPGSRYWFTAGGGLDPGESPREGAARELREETGLTVTPDALGGPIYSEVADFPYDGRWYRQEQEFFVLRVDSWEVEVDGFDAEERASIDTHAWWSADDLDRTDQEIHPIDLARLLRQTVRRRPYGRPSTRPSTRPATRSGRAVNR
jgi:8-oxo-dGTP pyrophosphatase MutT (NUDIX family)